MNENKLIDKNLELIKESNTQFFYRNFVDSKGNKLGANAGKRYADKLKTLKLIIFDNYAVELTNFGLEVCNQGGWLIYIKNKTAKQLKNAERQELEDKKLAIDYEQAKYNYNTRWIAIIGLGLAIFSAIASLVAIFKD